MPKGRTFAPSSGHEGIWFQHRGLPDAGPHLRESSTSTGLMLSAPYNPRTAAYPPQPPQPYSSKNTTNFKDHNAFSAHDNRHSFQDHGVYFGDGDESRTLGKHLINRGLRHHSTGTDFLKHNGREIVNYSYKTNYHSAYDGPRPPKTTNGDSQHHRFPKIHRDGSSDSAKLSTTTTAWFNELGSTPYQTPTNVLAVSQEPFLASNSWKYSYHGKSKCYPAYDHVHPKNPFSVWTVKGVPGKCEG